MSPFGCFFFFRDWLEAATSVVLYEHYSIGRKTKFRFKTLIKTKISIVDLYFKLFNHAMALRTGTHKQVHLNIIILKRVH